MTKNNAGQRPVLTAIKAQNNLVLSEKGKLIPPYEAIWTNKKGSATINSCAAFDMIPGRPATMLVELSAAPPDTEDAVLEALLGKEILFSGPMEGKRKVVVACTVVPESFTGTGHQKLQWQIRRPNKKITVLQKTALELYWLSLSALPATAYIKGTPLEAIRRLHSMAPKKKGSSIKALGSNAIPIYSIVMNVFVYWPPKYNVYNGSYSFVVLNNNTFNNITLLYRAYVVANYNAGSMLNCYDTAAVVQYYCQLNVMPVQYCFIQPFGYLSQTNLIGRGDCNNPFYGRNGTPVIIGETDPQRTAFGNHAFVSVNSTQNIADACAGPFVGTLNATAYLNVATDAITPPAPPIDRGTVSDIDYYTGVNNIINITSIHTLSAAPHMEAVKKLISFDPALNKANEGKQVAGAWLHPLQHPLLSANWQSIYEDLLPGQEEVLKIWMLKKGSKMIMIKLFVSSRQNSVAHNRFLTIASHSQQAVLPFEKGPDNIGHYSVVYKHKKYQHFVGAYYNAVIEITSDDPSVDVNTIASWYFTRAAKNLSRTAVANLPAVKVKLSGSIKEQLTISMEGSRNVSLDVIDDSSKARLIKATPHVLAFDKINPRAKKIRVLVIDNKQLLVNYRDIPLDKVSKK